MRDFKLLVETECALSIKPIIRKEKDLAIPDEEFKLIVKNLQRTIKYLREK